MTLFNYAQFIGDCVRSVERAAEELAAPLEILIVDDASTDDSLAQASDYQARSDARGARSSRNIGIPGWPMRGTSGRSWRGRRSSS